MIGFMLLLAFKVFLVKKGLNVKPERLRQGLNDSEKRMPITIN